MRRLLRQQHKLAVERLERRSRMAHQIFEHWVRDEEGIEPDRSKTWARAAFQAAAAFYDEQERLVAEACLAPEDYED